MVLEHMEPEFRKYCYQLFQKDTDGIEINCGYVKTAEEAQDWVDSYDRRRYTKRLIPRQKINIFRNIEDVK